HPSPKISTPSLHDALPISRQSSARGARLHREHAHAPDGRHRSCRRSRRCVRSWTVCYRVGGGYPFKIFNRKVREGVAKDAENLRSEEHTSELQSLAYLVCR